MKGQAGTLVHVIRISDAGDVRLNDYQGAADPELESVVCACVGRIADTLKPEYAQALRRVELDGVPVVEFAREAGISESNAGVRVFRAREALRREVSRSCGTCAEHGCFDCSCG